MGDWFSECDELGLVVDEHGFNECVEASVVGVFHCGDGGRLSDLKADDMKIYTRTGDEGQTGLYGGGRTDKDDVRIEAIGAVDELCANIGMARIEAKSTLDVQLEQIQGDLFSAGAELSSPDPTSMGTRMIDDADVSRLENWIDLGETDLPKLKFFVLPAGVPFSAHLHVCRAVCRRAERRVWTLAKQEGVDVSMAQLRYLNRLGDLLFVLARVANHQSGTPDSPWIPNQGE